MHYSAFVEAHCRVQPHQPILPLRHFACLADVHELLGNVLESTKQFRLRQTHTDLLAVNRHSTKEAPVVIEFDMSIHLLSGTRFVASGSSLMGVQKMEGVDAGTPAKPPSCF